MPRSPLHGGLDLAVRVAGGPGVVAEGAVRPTGHLVEQRQVARGARLVHDDLVGRPGNGLLFSVVLAAVKHMYRMMHQLGGAVSPCHI